MACLKLEACNSLGVNGVVKGLGTGVVTLKLNSNLKLADILGACSTAYGVVRRRNGLALGGLDNQRGLNGLAGVGEGCFRKLKCLCSVDCGCAGIFATSSTLFNNFATLSH